MIKSAAVVAKREIAALLGNRRNLFSILTFIVVWSVISLPRITGRMGTAGGVDSFLFFFATLLCIYIVFVFSSQAFLVEKRDGRIGTLLCTPLTVRSFWFGKVIGIAVPAFVIGIVVSAALSVILGFRFGAVSFPGLLLILYIFCVLPLITAAFAGILGFVQLLLGMRENRIVNIVILMLIFGSIGAVIPLTDGKTFLSRPLLGLLFASAALLLFIAGYIIRYIRKEKIIISLG
jgi:ABC-2 type transport system permease protein